MTNATHTPGPWTIEGAGDYFRIADENDRDLAEIPFRNPGDTEATETEDYANARLISAAPDMLRDAAAFLAWFRVFVGEQTFREINAPELAALQATLAKARE